VSNPPSPDALRFPESAAPDQICFLVDNVETAVSAYGTFSGVAFDFYAIDTGEWPAFRHRGEKADLCIRYALGKSTPQIELIEPAGGNSIYEEHVAEHGYGFHHLGYFVTDLELYKRQMTRAGYSPIFEGSRMGLTEDGAFAYYDTTRVLGHIIEVIVPPTRRAPAISTFNG
jgi:methylmalonyl-CoA/ethylmalonyl-CoA epimerase